MKATRKALATLGMTVFLATLGLAPAADACIEHLTGTLTTSAVPCETLCTAGPLTGGLDGMFEFTMDEMTDTGIPDVVRYTGTNTITTDQGTMTGPNFGYWNLVTGDCVDFTDVQTGTGAYAGVTGKITIAGRYDPATGQGLNHYIAILNTH
jgi:hypothetical protein